MTEYERLQAGAERIVEWFRKNRKSLPWRENITPYKVWVSEIMLQQTRIEAVIPYYDRFLRELPDIASLAAAEDDRLMKLWQGLGYYTRARNLKKTAAIVSEKYGGELPSDAKELRLLPGIGDYTAGAIASIAYGKAEPAVDGNVMRVFSRLNADGGDIALPETKKRITEALRKVYPVGEDASFLTQGIMEVGELVCIPNGEPLCGKCPIADLCLAKNRGLIDLYPIKSPKKERTTEERTILVYRCGDFFSVEKRDEKGLLAGLWQFPNVPGKLGEDEALNSVCGAGVLSVRPLGESVHVFTHKEWHMTGYLIEVKEMPPSFEQATKEDILKKYAIPSAFRHYVKAVLRA